MGLTSRCIYYRSGRDDTVCVETIEPTPPVGGCGGNTQRISKRRVCIPCLFNRIISSDVKPIHARFSVDMQAEARVTLHPGTDAPQVHRPADEMGALRRRWGCLGFNVVCQLCAVPTVRRLEQAGERAVQRDCTATG